MSAGDHLGDPPPPVPPDPAEKLVPVPIQTITMAPGSDPTFSGSSGEAIDVYISKCKFFWAGRGLVDDELKEARAVTLRGGLTGAAAEYATTLDIDIQIDFDKLSTCLKDRFPFKKREVDQMDTINKVMGLKQGTKTFEAYCEEAVALKPLLGSDLESLLAQRWVNGLRNESAAAAIAMQQAAWAEADRDTPSGSAKKLNITRTIEYAKFYLGSAVQQPVAPVSDTDKIVAALKDLVIQQQAPARGRFDRADHIPRQQQPGGARALPSPGEENMVCFRCGKTGHRAFNCNETPLPHDEQAKIRAAAAARQAARFDSNLTRRDPPLSQTLGQPKKADEISAPSSSDASKQTAVHFADTSMSPVIDWNADVGDIPRVNAVSFEEAKQAMFQVYKVDDKTDMRSLISHVYAAGQIRQRPEWSSDQSNRAGPSNTQQSNTQQAGSEQPDAGPSKGKSTRPEPEQDKIPRMPGEPMMPKRSIRGLRGNRINIREYLNQAQTCMSLAQLCDISPAVRAEFAHQLQLRPEDKKRKPPKRHKKNKNREEDYPDRVQPEDTEMPEVNMVGIPSSSSSVHVFSVTSAENEHHDDAIVPLSKDAVELFYTRVAVAVNCTDNQFRVASLSRVLVDGGSSSNLVPKYLVDQLKIRTVPITGGQIEVADGHKSGISSLVWLQVTAGMESGSGRGVTRVVAAMVVDGEPSYQLLLGRHWMHTCDITGSYRLGTYTFVDDDGKTCPMLRTDAPQSAGAAIRRQQNLLSGPIHVQVDAARPVSLNTSSYDEDTEDSDDEDVDEDDVDGDLCALIREAEEEQYLADESESEN
ncbi:hypothetical protein PoHVEF18_003018 [Penicillium ochrochloron]